MAARQPSWIFVSAQYLKKPFFNWFEMLHIYWYISDKGPVWFWTQSKIQYGCQEAILDFYFRLISQEAFEQLIKIFAHLLVHIRRRSSSIFGPDQKSNMATRRPSWIFISAQYLKKPLSNWFEILHIYWYVLDKGQVQFWTWSEIQYGRQVAILD